MATEGNEGNEERIIIMLAENQRQPGAPLKPRRRSRGNETVTFLLKPDEFSVRNRKATRYLSLVTSTSTSDHRALNPSNSYA